MKKIKIVRIISRLVVGGPSFHAVNLTSGVDSGRFESIIVYGSPNAGEKSLLDEIHSKGLKTILIPEMVSEGSLKSRDVVAVRKIYDLLWREQPQIVHTHTAKAGVLGRIAARLAGVPVIVHTYHGHILHGYYGPVKSWTLRKMEKALSYVTDHLIAVSEQVKKDLVAYRVASGEKITVIPLGLELQPYLDCGIYRGVFRKEVGLGNGHKLVGIVGRLVSVKNHRLFFDAAAAVAAKEPGARFVVVGDGPLRQEMERHALAIDIYDRVIFTGWRRDMPKIYADLDVLVVSSINEGTPVSAIEAMAAGCAVVGTRVGGVPDIVHEGETGYLVPPGDAIALSDAILRVISDRTIAAQIGKTAQDVVRQRFRLNRLIEDIEKLYLGLLGRKKVELA